MTAVPTGLNLLPANFSGTKGAKPTIAGGIKGATIPLFEGPSAIGTGTLAVGDSSITPAGSLSQDANVITATQRVGRVASAPSAALNFTPDAVAPAAFSGSSYVVENDRHRDAGQAERAYPAPAVVPTQAGPDGIRYDVNEGARVVLPARSEGKWRVRLRDLGTGNVLFESENQGARISSSKRYFVRFGIDVWDVSAAGVATPVLAHDYDARGREVLIQFPVGTLGDVLAWFPYAVRFAEEHGCRLTCAMSDLIIPLLRDAYPTIRFVTPGELVGWNLAETFYATYSMGLFFDDTENLFQPTDFRHVGLHRTAGYILGVDPREEAPNLVLPDESRPIPEPYVCIAVQASAQSKYWNNPTGWQEVLAFLKGRGFRVICIDQRAVHGSGLVWNHIPHGAEDETGDKPLAERARWLRHASAFVGLSSGLSWLAWAAGCPVVMISGFTHPNNEFGTPYRVINWHTCNGCWNDVRHRFDHKDFLWCPRHAGTPRQFECTKLITGHHVLSALRLALDASSIVPPADIRVGAAESALGE